jgi:hypothetical protein
MGVEAKSYLEWGDRVVLRSKSKPYDYLRVTPLGLHRWTSDINEATVFRVSIYDSREYHNALKRHRAYAQAVKVEERPSPQLMVIEPPEDD